MFTINPFPRIRSNGKETVRVSLRESLTKEDRDFIDGFETLVANIYSTKKEFINKFLFDRRRDLADECGYPAPNDYDIERYQDLYDIEPYAQRVVDFYPKECWKQSPSVYENNDPDNLTPFEQSLEELSQSLRGDSKFKAENDEGNPLWDYLYRLDLLSGIGRFGVMLIGFDDGMPLHTPVKFIKEIGSLPTDYPTRDGDETTDEEFEEKINNANQEFVTNANSRMKHYKLVTNKRKTNADPNKVGVLYLRVFPEYQVQVSQYETNSTSYRFGQPTMYLITLIDTRTSYTGIGVPNATLRVHWSRVIHVVDDPLSNEVFGNSRMRPVVRPLLDIHKVRGSSAEMYYKGAFPGLAFETPAGVTATEPNLDSDQVRLLREMIEQYENGLQRYLTLLNLQVKSIAPQVVDPNPQLNVQIESIAVKEGIPIRILKGSERGELSSSQDVVEFAGRITHRRNVHVTPRIICNFIDRCINVGALIDPETYTVSWPDPLASSDTERVDIGLKRAQAISLYIQSGAKDLMSPIMFFIYILGFTEDEAIDIYEEAQSILTGEESDLTVPEDGQEQEQEDEESTNPESKTEVSTDDSQERDES